MLLWEGVLHNDTTVAAREIFPGRGGGGAPHMKGVGMPVGNFEVNP